METVDMENIKIVPPGQNFKSRKTHSDAVAVQQSGNIESAASLYECH